MRKFKMYFDKDTEEAWLQSMCEQGWAFKSFFLGLYTFEPCQPGEYIYRIDLMAGKWVEQERFLAFMREAGVEPVGKWYRWCYLRRKASEGPFELYSDAESKIAHYTRIRRFFLGAMVFEIICSLTELNGALQTGETILWVFFGTLSFFVFALARMALQCSRKIRRLQGA